MKINNTGSYRRKQACFVIVPIALITAVLMAVSVHQDVGPAQTVIMIFSALVYLSGFSSLIGGVWTSGMIPPMLVGAFAFISAARWEEIRSSIALTVVFTVLITAFCAAFAAAAVISAGMVKASLNTPRAGERITVVVLGCRVKGARPSLMLKGRLDAAARLLKRERSTVCIVSGGRGTDEEYTEALVMRRYLIEDGIEPERVIEEDNSFSTAQNIVNSLAIIESLSLPNTMAIATDRFHQYRAALLAERLGIESRAVNRETRWYLVMQYWLREIAGILLIKLGRTKKNAGR